MSSRKNRSPEEQARRAKIRELLQESNISSMEDIQNLFKETIAEFMENGLDAELDNELGYSKYDYKNKETENSRNGHSSICNSSRIACTLIRLLRRGFRNDGGEAARHPFLTLRAAPASPLWPSRRSAPPAGAAPRP